MIDFNDVYLTQIERFLQEAVERSGTLSSSEIDPREIVYQIIEQVKQHCYGFGEFKCVPNIVTISMPESKGDKAEDIETIFTNHEFLSLFSEFLVSHKLRLFNPLRVEVQTVSKGNSRVMFGRAGFAFDWPGTEMGSEDVRVNLDPGRKQILSVQPPSPQIPQLARLTSLNALVYQNQYLITKPHINIGRLRSVIDEESGKMIRRNDFVFAHLEPPQAISNSVSRQHASIVFRGGFTLTDHGSSNGTAILRSKLGREFPIKPEEPFALEHGDMIRFGSAWVNFELVPLQEASKRNGAPLPADHFSHYSPDPGQ